MKPELVQEAAKHIESLTQAKSFFASCVKKIEKEIERIGEDDPNADTGKLEDEQSDVESVADDLGDVIRDAKKVFK